MAWKVLLLLVALLATALSVPVHHEELPVGCDCGSITGALQNVVTKLTKFLGGLVYSTVGVVGCSLADVLELAVHLIHVLLNVLSTVLGLRKTIPVFDSCPRSLAVPEVPPEKPYQLECKGLEGAINDFYQLLAELLSDYGESKRCNCQVPSSLGGLGSVLATLLNVASKILAGLLGGGANLSFEEDAAQSANLSFDQLIRH
ncbi:hypothetical protein QR680_008943 [Steinernema hermaphroditum]|uniref:Saposin B-type domain-containing protein n=1 Tax=Steinernema hermaphroditum TaxID=289476 RepID=A0AA39M904_9BILA|nr:hypothetical protein QR680_008943 [Steinernema hermaphroditum]